MKSDPAPEAQGEPSQAAEPRHNARYQSQRQRILAAAVASFAREGFHGTSMHTICAEAGMSPGALYRYFPSKEAIIAAIVEGEQAERLRIFDALSREPDLLTALMECLRALLVEPTLPTAALGPEIMAEAIRNRALKEVIEPVEEEARTLLHAALEGAVDQGEVDPALDLSDVLLMLQIIGDGAILHHQLHPEWNIPARLTGLSALVRRMVAPRHKPAPQD